MKTINLNIDKLGNITIDLDLKVNAYLLLEKTKKPKQLFYEILKDNFINPKLTKEIFNKISKEDLRKIGMLIIEANNLKEFYKDYKDKSFYYSFKVTLLKNKKSIEKRLKFGDELFNKIKYIQDNISNLNITKIMHEQENRYSEFLSSLNNISKKINEEINKISEGISNFFKSSFFKESAQKYFERIGPNGEKLVEILAERNWILPLDVPLNFGSLIIDLYENKPYDEIDNLMLNLVKKEELENLTNKWYDLKYFKKRENILKAGINAHIEGYYELSIYTLLPHIEGIIWDFLRDLYCEDELKKIAKSPVKKFEYLGNYYVENIRIDFMIKPFFDNISDKFPLYAHKDFSEISEDYDQLNRHVLFHGIITNCFSEINSLKLIYILDFLWYIIDFNKKNQKHF